MKLVRAFIAIETSPEIKKAIEKQTAPLQNVLGSSMMRWVPSKNIHLTLKFLGDISASNVEMLTQLLNVEASQHSAFEIQFSGLGVFPNAKRPRVMWIGIQAPDGLAALHRGIDAAAAKLGFPGEKHAFSPHLTIGRVKKNISSTGIQKIRATLEETQIGLLGSALVNAVHIFKSDLKPSGAVYTQLHTAPLRNATQ